MRTLNARMYKHTLSAYEGVDFRSVREEKGRWGGTGSLESLAEASTDRQTDRHGLTLSM